MCDIRIIDIDNNIWNNIVLSFSRYDVYYLSDYVKAFKIHGDGEPILIYYNSDELRGIYVAMKRDISKMLFFKNEIEYSCFFDLVSPYGYGGFLLEGNRSENNLNKLKRIFVKLMCDENIITDFVRYHPVLQNAVDVRSVFNVIDLGNTISLDLSSEEIIWSNITSKNRNMIRKAEKAGIVIKHCHEWKMFEEFIRIYNATMDKDNAIDYYYFEEDFYRSIYEDLEGNFEIFYAELGGEIISISIFLFANNQMHYHLSGSVFEYRNLAPSNLLLYKVACWGCKQGFKIFHLGGGVGSGQDNLYKFKANFNRNSSNQFSIGKMIFNQEIYDKLVNIRLLDKDFNINSSFFPLYRAV